ncbi:MAG TPA: hypothetical protein VMK65_08900 [Longimicrobiales bacterium]|nr:hypothetical protein [Longimicrobiales bacterium]
MNPPPSPADARVPVRLVFADRGSFHEMVVDLPSALLERHARLIDALREEPEITEEIYVDPRRLVAAYREPGRA